MEAISRQECKEIQLAILRQCAVLCEQHGLNYYLAYGTMLGAVRHHGFIPWDDDIDIYLTRPDYDRLIQLLCDQHTEKPKWLEVLDLTCKGYYYPFAKLVDNRTVAKMENNITDHGVWIDLFPIDGLPADERKSTCFAKYCAWLRQVVIAMTTDFSSKNLYSWKNTLKRRVYWMLAQIAGKKRIAIHYEKMCRKYPLEMSDYAGCLFTAYGSRDRMPKRVFFEKTQYAFEGESFYGPKDYDTYLKTIYGDYMTPPPENKRIAHYVKAWKK